MDKRIPTIALGILMLAGVMAMQIYAGESKTITLDNQYEYYSIVGNITPIIIEITQSGNNVTITPDKYMSNQTFTIIFFDKDKEIITEHHYSGGGGGSSTKYVDRNITKNIPIYINNSEIVNKEIPIEKIIYKERGYKLWYILFELAIILILLIYLIIIKSSNKIHSNPNNQNNS